MVSLVVGIVLIVFSVATMTNYRGFAEKYERVTFSWWLGLSPDHRWARRQVSLIRLGSVGGLIFGCVVVAHAFSR